MAKIKDENKLQIQLKIDKTKDREIFDIINVADNKSDFIKDALFYFIYHIEQGKVINRNYPYNKVNMRIDINMDDESDIIEVPKTYLPTENEEVFVDDSESYEDEYDENFDDVDF